MDQQYYTTISLEDFKRLYPNLNLESLQVVPVGGGVSDDSQNTQQQVIVASDESLVLSEAPIQQLVTYQQSAPSAQTYIIQNTDNDSGQQSQAVAQSSIYYTTEVPTDQIIHHQQAQQQQQLDVSHQVHQGSSQQSMLLQKAMGTPQQQATPILQQPMTNQSGTHQHVIMQQTPHIVLQQQSPQQHQQQSSGQILLRSVQGSGMNQQRYVYQQQPARAVVYNTQQQTTITNQHHVQQQHHIQHQSAESATAMQQQQPRQLIVSGQQQLQTNLIYQSPHGGHHIQQQQQTTQAAKRPTESVLASSSRIVRSPRAALVNQSQTPKLAPFRMNGPRFHSPNIAMVTPLAAPQTSTTGANTTQNPTPAKPPTVKQQNRRASSARGRGTTSPRSARGGISRGATTGQTFIQNQQQTQDQPQQQTQPQQHQVHQVSTQQQTSSQPSTLTPSAQQYVQNRTIQYSAGQVVSSPTTVLQPQRQNIPPLISSSVSQRIINAVVGGGTLNAGKGLTASGQIAQRVIATQTAKIQTGNAGVASIQPAQQLVGKYRIPKLSVTSNPSGNTSNNSNNDKKLNRQSLLNSDLEESIQAVVVTKANEQTTHTPPISTSETSPKYFQTTLTTYSTIDSTDDDKKLKINNGRVISLTEFKRQQQQQKQQQTQNQMLNKQAHVNRVQMATGSRPSINNSVGQATATIQKPPGQQSAVAGDENKKIVKTQVQNHIIQPISTNKLQNPSGDPQKSARMLVVLSSGEQRLITFTLPRESCTVQELLEQVGVPFTSKTSIQCVPNPGASIDYIVTVGITMNESPTELATAAENTLQLTKQQQEPNSQQNTSSDQSTASGTVSATTQNNSTEKPAAVDTPKEIPAKLIPGFLAVCTACGYTGSDFAKCERCKRVFTEEPKRVATAKGVAKSEEEKKKAHSDLLSRAAAKACLASAAPTLTSIRGGKVLITTTTVRGRGRGAPRIKPAEIEPVILTLSSDDEGDDDNSMQSAKTPVPASSPPVQKAPLPCEPLITESMTIQANMEREDIGLVVNTIDQLYTAITCKIIRFGTYRYDPKEKVLISSKGIKIVAPSCKNPLDAVVLNIQMREIVKIVAHLSKSLNILFIYTLPGCGVYIRESLEMKAKSPDTPYYNPTDRSEPYKRIVLQMDTIAEEAKAVIRSIFSKAMLEEVQCSEANELLMRSCLKDKYIKQEQGASAKPESENIRQILIYPPGKGGIPINTEDYMCLAIDQYLNDVIIDFFLKYLHTNVLSDEQKLKTHIFSSFFYNRLTTMTTRQRHSEKDVKLTASQKRHARVKSWTKNVNLFEKDFIIIPINEQSHWFLAIICFPRLQGPVTYDTNEPVVNQPTVKKKKATTEKKVSLQIGSTTITPLSKRELDAVCLADDSLSERDEAEGDESDLASDESDNEGQNGSSSSNNVAPSVAENPHRPIKQPLILIFDSLAGASRSRVVATLRDYLTCEYRAKIKEDSVHVFNKFNMPGHCVKVPQQNNFTDCGLYVLQYVEQFFKDSIKDYKLPIKQLVNWFETIVVTRKREEISNLLKGLVEKYNPDRLPLPEIVFPTLDGKLVEPELTDEQAEFEEEEMDEEGEEEDEEELDSLADGEIEGEVSPVKRNGEKRTIALTPNATTITLKRPFEAELSRSQEPIVRKTARMSEPN